MTLFTKLGKLILNGSGLGNSANCCCGVCCVDGECDSTVKKPSCVGSTKSWRANEVCNGFHPCGCCCDSAYEKKSLCLGAGKTWFDAGQCCGLCNIEYFIDEWSWGSLTNLNQNTNNKLDCQVDLNTFETDCCVLPCGGLSGTASWITPAIGPLVLGGVRLDADDTISILFSVRIGYYVEYGYADIDGSSCYGLSGVYGLNTTPLQGELVVNCSDPQGGSVVWDGYFGPGPFGQSEACYEKYVVALGFANPPTLKISFAP